MKIAIFGFDDFGEQVAKFLNKKDIVIVFLTLINHSFCTTLSLTHETKFGLYVY